MSDLTVICGATLGPWERRARRALDSVKSYAPDVETLLWRGPAARRMKAVGLARTPRVLFIDADVLATGDVRELVSRLAGRAVLARISELHSHPQWHPDRYRTMLERAGLAYRHLVCNGVFLMSSGVARQIADRVSHWRSWYGRYRPPILDRRHKKPDIHAFTLALAEAGIGDAQTAWAGPAEFGWHSHPGELGIIHHFNGETYCKLEAAGALEGAIAERLSTPHQMKERKRIAQKLRALGTAR
jgi:hypothetical protein